MKKLFEGLDFTEINEKDTLASAFLKGATTSYVKITLICGLIHLGIKAYEHSQSKSEDGEA